MRAGSLIFAVIVGIVLLILLPTAFPTVAIIAFAVAGTRRARRMAAARQAGEQGESESDRGRTRELQRPQPPGQGQPPRQPEPAYRQAGQPPAQGGPQPPGRGRHRAPGRDVTVNPHSYSHSQEKFSQEQQYIGSTGTDPWDLPPEKPPWEL